MDKKTRRRTAVELLKDLLIVLLACSALWMIGAEGLGSRVWGGTEESPRITGTQNAVYGDQEGARPSRITVTLQNDGEPERCVVQYDDSAVDALFQQTAGLLMEALSSAEEPQAIPRSAWNQALIQAPGFCFDFQGELPLSVLSGWLGVECSLPDAAVRRVLLTVWKDSVALYYYDRTGETWYRCTTQVVSAAQLEHALSGLSANGAYYAFESEETAAMDPDTVLVSAPGPVSLCQTSNPASGGQSSLEELMTGLGFNLSGCVFYPAADEEVARSGSDTLRLSSQGVLEYSAGADKSQQFPTAAIPGESEVFSAVESCRQILLQTAAKYSGQARLYLSGVEQTKEGWHVEFEYSVNGIPVQLKSGPAASFEVRGGSITDFTLRLRSYEAGEGQQLILPPVQAAAAMDALDLRGRELQLTYRDTGEDTAVPGWMAVTDEG